MYDSTMEAMECPQIKTMAIIAEGVPEQQTRKIIQVAEEKKVRAVCVAAWEFLTFQKP